MHFREPLKFIAVSVATSNAPATGRKRRLSTSERDQDAQFASKRSRGGPPTVVEEADAAREESPRPTSSADAKDQEAEEEVKEVTTGVKQVELDDRKAKDGAEDEAPPASPAPTEPVESEPEADEFKALADAEAAKKDQPEVTKPSEGEGEEAHEASSVTSAPSEQATAPKTMVNKLPTPPAEEADTSEPPAATGNTAASAEPAVEEKEEEKEDAGS
jgi:hypothetical protein